MLLKDYFAPTDEYFYRDITYVGSESEYVSMIKQSCTLYVGDISVTVDECRLWELFSIIAGRDSIKRIIMGKNRKDMSKVGFAFIEYYDNMVARRAQQLLNGIRMDNKYIKCDIDYGFKQGREYGRGYYGGQFKNDSKRYKKVQARNKRWI